ncbi:MAG: DinB family protein [Candidatus Izemoplasmatales bacterium]
MIIKTQKTQFTYCLEILKQVIEKSDETIWTQKVGGHVFWQQILHTLMGTYFWFRDVQESFDDFKEPFKASLYYPEFEKDPENNMTKAQMFDFYHEVCDHVDDYFEGKTNDWLTQPAKLYDQLTNNDVINMQIRHVMYHVGFLSALLKDHRDIEIKWDS